LSYTGSPHMMINSSNRTNWVRHFPRGNIMVHTSSNDFIYTTANHMES